MPITDINVKEFSESIVKFFKENAETLMYFRERWEDEKEYENIEDYKIAIQKLFKDSYSDFELTQLTKKFTISIASKFNPQIVAKVTIGLSGRISYKLYSLRK